MKTHLSGKMKRMVMGLAVFCSLPLVAYGQASQFAITLSGGTTPLSSAALTSGTPVSVRVTAQITAGIPDPVYAGTVTLTSNAFSGSVQATISPNPGGFVDGVVITPTIAGANRTITANDGTINTPNASGNFTVNPGPTSQLVITGPLPASSTAGVAFTPQPSISLEDAQGNVVTTDNSTVITASINSGSSTLQGTTTATAASGVATFANLSYQKAESITLRFTDGSHPVISGSMTVNPAGASTVTSTIAANPTSIVANGASTSAITVQLKDAFGNNLTASGGTVTIASTLGGMSVVSDNANGTYSATLTSGTTVGTATVTAKLNNVSLTNSTAVGFTSGTASKFAVTMSGGSTLLSAAPKTAGTSFLVRVTAQDANGNTVTGYTGTVNLTSNAYIGSVPAGITTGGFVDNISVTPTSAGVADRVITTSDGTINAGGSGNFTVNPGPASTATSTVSANPTSIVANGITTSAITVQLKDAFNNNLVASGGSVVVSTNLGTIPSTTDNANGTYSATLTSGIVAGPATVSALLNGNPVTSTASVTLTAGPLTKFAVTMTGGTTPLSAAAKTAGVTFQTRVTAQDANGNTVTTYTGTVTLSSTAFSGTVPAVISANGLVDNVNITPTIAGSSKTIAATNGTITTSPASSTFTVNPAAAKKAVVTQEPSSTAVAGQAFVTQPWVSLEDSLGNVISTDNGTIVTAAAIGGTGTLGGTLTAATSAGVAKFTNLSYPKSETIRIRFTAGSLVADTSIAIVVSSGGASKVAVTREPSATAIAGQNFATQPQVAIEDALGNVIMTDNASSIGVQVLGGTGGTLNGTTPVTVVAGVATFTNLNYTKMESIRLRFTSGALISDTSVTIVVNHGAADSMALVSGNGQTAPISTSLSPMIVHVTDLYGNSVDSATIGYAVTGFPIGATGSFAINPSSTSTNAAGNASSVLTLGNKVGLYTVQASASLKGNPIPFTATATPGAAGRLVILQQPNTSQIAGRIFTPNLTVSVQDSFGNIVTTDNHSQVTATLTQGTGLLQGTLTQTVANGQAAFADLSHSIAEQIGIQLSSPGLSSATTNPITVTADTAYALAIVQQPPTSVNAGAILSPALKVQLVDKSGNQVAKSGVTVTTAVGSGNPEIEGTKVQTTNATGAVTFADLSFLTVGGRRLQFTSTGLVRAVSDSLTVTSAGADTLVFVANPSNSTAGTVFATAPVVEARDRYGNAVTGVALTIGLTLTNPQGAVLSGPTSVPVTQTTGRATFPGLSVNKTGTFTLTATAAGIPAPKPGVSASFTINPAPAVRLAFTQQPTTVVAGIRIQPSVVVAVQDTFGNVVTTSSDSIGLSINGGGALLGGSKKQASSGIATFDSLIVTTSGTGKTLTAAAKTLTPVTSVGFQVRPAPPTKLVFSTQPGNGVAGTTLTQLPVVTMQDQFGNTVLGVAQKVALSIRDTATTGGSLLDASHTTKVDSITANIDTLVGRAAFSGVAINKAGHGYTLTVTGSTVQPIKGVAVSDTFNITPGTAQKVRIETLADGTGTQLLNQKVSSGTSISIYAVSRDGYDNFVSNVAADVGGWSLTVFTGGIISGDLVPSGDRRSAVFSGHVVGSARINVAVAGLTSVTSDTITVVQAGAPTKVAVETAGNGTGQIVPSQSLESGRSITMYSIARDASDNFVGNIAADWLLVKLAGGIADTDLVASGDKKSAVFTGHRVGRAQILASNGALSGIRSDTLTVVNGSAALLVPQPGTTPLTAPVGGTFSTPLAAQVVDSSGNPVPAAIVRFSSPLSGPSSFFGTRQDTSVVANSAGIATAPPMQANNISGTYYDTAAVHGATPALFSLTNNSASISSFTITSTNGGRIGTQFTQVPFQVRIAARDSFGNVATGFTGTATVTSTGQLVSGGGTTPNFVGGLLASYPVTFDSAGLYIVTVRRTGGNETGVSDTITVVNPAPTFTSLTPGNGLAGSTLQITIRGTGFIPGVTVVLFSDARIRAFNPIVDSFTQLRVTVQVDSSITPGSKNVTIANIQPGGGTVVVQNGFTVGNNPSPVLTSIVPASGIRGRTMTAGLIGGNFVPGASTVDFGQGITVTTLTVDSASHITATISVSASAQVGNRLVTVVNAPPGGGTSDGVTFTVNADPSSPPALAAPPSGYSVQSTQVTLQWSPPLSDSVATYQAQVSGDTTFATRIIDTTVTTNSIQVGPLTTYSTYFWRVRAKRTSGLTSSYTAPWTFNTYPAQISLNNNVPFPVHDSPGQYSQNDYRMLGLPGADNSLMSKYLTGTAGTDWIAYYDNGADSSYLVKYAAGDTMFTFTRGRAFWILCRGSWSVSGQVAGMMPDSTGYLRIALHSGWNMISNPSGLVIQWSKVQSANGGIGDSIWNFDGTTMGVQQTFKPYVGYYFENKSHLKYLVIPGGINLTKPAVPAVPTDTTWTVSMSMEQQGALVDRSTWFGVAPDATADCDRHDFHKPRALSALSQLVFERPDWDTRAPQFACDIRPPGSGVQSWDVTALTPDPTSRKTPFTVRFAGVDGVPAGNEVYLLDRKRETYQDLRAKAAYTFTAIGASAQFTILIGSSSDVKKQLEEIGPKEFSLDQNYPNPFNPTTTISFTVPMKADVNVTIYNILGARVKVLQSGVLAPGRHFIQWDGTNDVGRMTGTGVYFCRMNVTGGPGFTRKMLLIK